MPVTFRRSLLSSIVVFAFIASLTDAIPEGTVLDPNVPLSHCARFGREGAFQLEWEINGAPKHHLEFRFTSDIQRGKFTAFGFTRRDRIQLVTGYPVEHLACARSLWDTASAFDVNGNVYPNHPELPGKVVAANDTHASHYIMRNLSVTADAMMTNGGTVTTNITIMWAYMQASLFFGSCYMGNTVPYTEAATFDIVLSGTTFQRSANGGACKKFEGPITSHRFFTPIDPGTTDLLDREENQNRRVAALLVGGDMLLESGKQPPVFDAVLGRVLGGEGGNGVCQTALSVIHARWSGFSDKVGGIKEYLVSLGTTALPSFYVDRASAGTNEAFTYTLGEALTPNSSFIVTVHAVNYAGLDTTITSKVVRVLNGGTPLKGWIQDGLLPASGDLQFQQSSTTLGARWGGWLRREHSSINHDTGVVTDNGAEYAVGELGSAVDGVVGWTSLGATFATQVSLTGLSLQHGVTYTISVRARSCSTVYTTQTSNGITVDQEPPLPGFVRFGNVSWIHHAVANVHETLKATWTGFVDRHSGIGHYEWGMGTVTPAPDTTGSTGFSMPWTNVGLATSATGPNLHTYFSTDGQQFYIYLKSVDAVGNFVVITSNATTVRL